MKHVAIAIVSAACCIALASYAARVDRFLHVEVTNACGTTAEVVLLLDIYDRQERSYRLDPSQWTVLPDSHGSREILFRATLVDDDVVAWTGKQVHRKTDRLFAYTDIPSFWLFGGRVDFELCGPAGAGDSVLPVRRGHEPRRTGR